MKNSMYSVTGVENGAFVQAKSNAEARKIFKLQYNNERIICVKKWSMNRFINFCE